MSNAYLFHHFIWRHRMTASSRNTLSQKNQNAALRSVSPKISRIGRQKRNNEFFLIWPKEPFWWTIFGNDIKRVDFLFLSLKFAKLENSATAECHQWRPWGLKFCTSLTCSYGRTKRCLEMSFTQCLWHLLSFTQDQILFKNVSFYKVVNLWKPNHLLT